MPADTNPSVPRFAGQWAHARLVFGPDPRHLLVLFCSSISVMLLLHGGLVSLAS